MQPSIRSNLSTVQRRYRGIEPAVKRELARGAKKLAEELTTASVQILDRDIYQHPVAGRTWELSRQLRGGEKARTRGATIIMANRARHARARHALGTAEGRRIRTPGVKSTQWHREVLVASRGRIVEERRRAVVRGLRAGQGV